MRRFAGGMANNDAFAGVQAVSTLPKAGQLLGEGIAECERIGTGFVEGANAIHNVYGRKNAFVTASSCVQPESTNRRRCGPESSLFQRHRIGQVFLLLKFQANGQKWC